MLTEEEEKKMIFENLTNNKKTTQAYLQGVNYINELLRSGLIDDLNFLIELFRLMFKFKTIKGKKFMLEKALINICYKNFKLELFNILEKEMIKHKKRFITKSSDTKSGCQKDIIEFSNIFCSFGIIKLKYCGITIEQLDHFVKFCDTKYAEKIKMLQSKNLTGQIVDFNTCFNRFKTAFKKLHISPVDEYDVEMYFPLDDFYTLRPKILNFSIAKLTKLSSFQNNFERQMKRSLELFLDKKFTEAKMHLKDLRKNDLYKNHKAVRQHIHNLLIFCHAEIAEYFECSHYINLSIEEAMVHNVSFVYFYFLNLKFAIERIGCIEGPRSCIEFDFEDVKERRLNVKDLTNMDHIELNVHLQDRKLITQITLAVIKDDIRELRNIETNKVLDVSKLFNNLKVLSYEYSIISLYVIENILYINMFDKIINTEINFNDLSSRLNAILAVSKDILKRDIRTRKDKSDWWLDRLNLEAKLRKLLKDVKVNIELINEHVILILDEKSTNFPWEHTTFLKDKHVFRIPSLEYLEHKEMKRPVDGLSWIIDPDNNLEDTRKRISSYLETKNLTKNEDNCNVLLYFGHGGGSKYLKNIKNKILFLFGCCSSKILNVPNFKRNGKALNHLERGNTLVGCLWEVTDKDLDLISMRIIDNLFKNKCLACIIKESIGIAKLPYLNGCSLVVYGLPVILNDVTQ